MSALLAHLPPALLVIFRIGGLMIYGPIFGAPVIPVRVKVFLAAVIGLAVYPALAEGGLVRTDVRLDLWALAPAVGAELLIGLVVGYAASLPLVAVQTGGLLMGQQMGLGFARIYNPSIDDEADVVGQLLFFMALAGFLLVGGHEAMVLAVLRSFTYVPLAGFSADGEMLALVTGLLLASFELALRVAAPVLALVFLQSVAMGFMAKTIPQLNILSLGFPVRILAGLAMITVGLVVIDDVVMEEIARVLDAILAWTSQE